MDKEREVTILENVHGAAVSVWESYDDADARLIAAAPSMLELLRRAPVAVCTTSGSTVYKWEQERDALLAELDK